MDLKPGQVPLIDLDNPPDWTRPEWFLDCPNEPHIDTPFHHGRLMMASQAATIAIMSDSKVKTVADFGAGDGGLLETLKGFTEVDMWGYDLSRPSIDYAFHHRGINIERRDVINTEPEWPDLAIVTEFLEHLVDPFTFVRRAAEHCGWIVASSPFTETLEHHYPLHCWAFDLAGYRALLEDAGFEVVSLNTVDMFQVVLAVKA